MVRKLGRPTIACAAIMVAGCFTDVPSTSTTADTSTTAASATTAADLGGSAGTSCTPGSVTCPCYGNGTCDAGLSCQVDLQLCIPTACSPGENRCVCDGGGCAAPLLCVDGLCRAGSDVTGDGTSNSGSSTTTTTGSTSSPSPSTTSGVVCPMGVVTAEGECARIVFLSKDPVFGAGFGLPPGAAVQCNSDAKGAGLPGTYAALLWTTGRMDQTGDERVGLGWVGDRDPVRVCVAGSRRLGADRHGRGGAHVRRRGSGGTGQRAC